MKKVIFLGVLFALIAAACARKQSNFPECHTLLHVFPVDNNGNPNQTTHWIEKYVRLE